MEGVVGGYDYDVADDGVYDDFYCPICTKLLRDAVELECEHTLCSSCLNEWEKKARELQLAFGCAQCRRPINKSAVQRSGTVNRMIKTSIRVKCENSGDGCEWIGVIVDIKEHLKKKCAYTMVPCQFKDCKERMRRMSLNDHLLACEFRPVSCEYCGVTLSLKTLKNHQLSCPLVPVQCENKGCLVTVTRESLVDHCSNECKYQRINCQYSSVGCPVQLLECEVEKHEKDSMVSHMSLMMQELTVTKTLLKHSAQFNANSFVKTIRKRFGDMNKLEKLINEFTIRAHLFAEEVANRLTNPPDPNDHTAVFDLFIDLNFKACDMISTYDINNYKSVKEIFIEITSQYTLAPDYTEFLYKHGVEAACSDFILSHNKLRGDHENVKISISDALSSLQVLSESVRTSWHSSIGNTMANHMSTKRCLVYFMNVSNYLDLTGWKMLYRNGIGCLKRPDDKIVELHYPVPFSTLYVMKPFWNLGEKLELKPQDDGSWVCPFPLKHLVDEGCALLSGCLFIVPKI